MGPFETSRVILVLDEMLSGHLMHVYYARSIRASPSTRKWRFNASKQGHCTMCNSCLPARPASLLFAPMERARGPWLAPLFIVLLFAVRARSSSWYPLIWCFLAASALACTPVRAGAWPRLGEVATDSVSHSHLSQAGSCLPSLLLPLTLPSGVLARHSGKWSLSVRAPLSLGRRPDRPQLHWLRLLVSGLSPSRYAREFHWRLIRYLRFVAGSLQADSAVNSVNWTALEPFWAHFASRSRVF